MLSKNSLSYPILIAGFIATSLLALSLRPTPHHAFISMTNADKVAISYLWQADISKQNCQEKLGVLDDVVLAHCPNCKIQQQLCLASLNDQQKPCYPAKHCPPPPSVCTMA